MPLSDGACRRAGRDCLKTGKKGSNEWANQGLFDYDGAGLPALQTLKAL